VFSFHLEEGKCVFIHTAQSYRLQFDTGKFLKYFFDFGTKWSQQEGKGIPLIVDFLEVLQGQVFDLSKPRNFQELCDLVEGGSSDESFPPTSGRVRMEKGLEELGGEEQIVGVFGLQKVENRHQNVAWKQTEM
jgi:hypothetical protein